MNEATKAELLPEIKTLVHNWPVSYIIECMALVLNADIHVTFKDEKEEQKNEQC